ncbi:MAG TPA: hypothetical protein VI894_01225 [Candidatus Nanoarchaeia archaeon]|nr:hypothetical protein [Candidatus Nanoarchaeia archaeon]
MADEFKELNELKKQLEDIKKMSTVSPSAMQDSMDRLNKSINDLQNVFRAAIEELKMEEHEEATFTRKIEPLVKRVNAIHEQNEKIADGIVALADMMDEMKKQISDIHDAMQEKERPWERKYELPKQELFPRFPAPQQMSQLQPKPQFQQIPQQQFHQGIAPPIQPPQMTAQIQMLPPLGEELPPPPMPEKKGLFSKFRK